MRSRRKVLDSKVSAAQFLRCSYTVKYFLLYSSYNLKLENLCLLEGMLSIQHECGSSDTQPVSCLIVLLIIPSSLVLRCEEHVESVSLKFLTDTLTDA